MQLLREFAERQSETAFSELVRRHLNLVYSVALRQTGNAHQAEEITQAVFIILARKAGSLGRKTILSGWLYQTARLTAANFLRTERRRAFREQEAYMQSLSDESGPEVWPQIAPLLDDAMAKLGQKDRDAVVLRFLEGKSLQEVGAAMGASEDAAKMRVNRALEKLRKLFSKRGVVLTTPLIAGAVSASSVQAAPAGLAVTVTALTAPEAVVTVSMTTLVKGTIKIMNYTKLKLAVGISAGILVAGGVATVALSGDSANRQPQVIAQAVADLIVPGQSVGKVKKDMLSDQIVAELGQPDRKSGKTGSILEYTRLGFAVFTTPDGVPAVMCGDSSGAGGPLVKAFKARTKEGMGMGSTRDELVKAFGTPTKTEQLPRNGETLEFKPLGLRFTLQDGKVHHIIVDFRKAK